ncbi:hypothetical protein UFOVP270_22 [uncultured Caudovirales phage]|uniref:Uncharacterized protein n=1 Tax=uncultured Caudovirales phage TaxID=2100421 RepID=A0A6J5L9E2_9CAUD|nr:hypothetical protein UFOVP101_34 [uncultured Caudovirales phage]CAB4134145.1 hypothetical protein UFOVP270_22 [uncultured Caudovirales phage]
MPVLNYQVNAPCYGGINPKLVYIFTDDPISVVTETNYINWMANGQGIITGDVALIVTRETPTSILGVGFYEFERVGTTTNWNLVPIPGSIGVNSVTGTIHEIVASPTTGDVIVSIAPNPELPGTGSVGLPSGNTAQRAGIAGSIRFNTQLTQFEVTLDGINWIPLQTGSPGSVTSVSGTANEITVSPSTGAVVVAIANNPVLPGTAEVVLPEGTTGQRGSTAGGLRFNTQLNEIELTNDGINWYPVSNGSNTVNSVSGTTNRITVTGTNNVVVDISAAYVGQTSINTLGNVTTGSWSATPITVPFGGTGDTSFTPFAPIAEGSTDTSNLISLDDAGFNVPGYVLTTNGNAASPTWQAAPGSVITITTVPVTVAQIQGCYATPVLILAAPGAGMMINVVSIVFQLTIAGVAYFLPGSTNLIGFQYGSSTHLASYGQVVVPIQGQSFTAITNTKIGYSLPATCGPTFNLGQAIGLNIGTNAGIYMSANNVVSGGTGSGNSYVTVTYQIINVGL